VDKQIVVDVCRKLAEVRRELMRHAHLRLAWDIACLEGDIASLSALDEPAPVAVLADDVRALFDLCAACGEERGEHMAEPPHAAESGACAGFVPPARVTERVLDHSPTDPPPAMGEAS